LAVALLALALHAAPLAAGAQATKVPRIGVLSGDHPNDSPCLDRVRRGLSELGYEADGAEDGGQGLVLLERHLYDLVITDLQMPSMSGWDVVNAVRGRLPMMPMIMISGFATEDDVRQAQSVGMPLLHKPFSVVELRRVVSELLAAEA